MSDNADAEMERNVTPEPLPEEQIKYRIVDIKTGLRELNSALSEGNKEAIREAYNNLTYTYPTAVHAPAFKGCFIFYFLEFNLVQLGSIRILES